MAQLGIYLGTACLLGEIGAQETPVPAVGVVTNVARAEVSLTNRTVVLLARLRGVPAREVMIRPGSARGAGAFEIDLAGAKDLKAEGAALSKELGSAAVVIVDRVSDDGGIRTNWTFRSGAVEEITAPVGSSGLKPRAQRMYVWPHGGLKPPSAPSRLRVRSAAE